MPAPFMSMDTTPPPQSLAAGWARDAGVPVIADLDDLYPGVEELLGKIDYLITSRDIPGRLTGDPDLRQSLPVVRSRYGCRLTAATLGHEGVLAWDGSQFHYAPAFRVQPWTPPAPATSSTPDLSMDCCRTGRSPANLTSPVQPPR